MKNIKKNSLLYIQYTKKVVYVDQTEDRIKNVFRTHIHPNRIGAIWDSETKQLLFNDKPGRLEFGGSKRPFFCFLFGVNLLYSLHRRFVNFLIITN